MMFFFVPRLLKMVWDQPNANTMLVYDADKLGLSQIYQMRGRVGRSEKISACMVFLPQGKSPFRSSGKTVEYDPGIYGIGKRIQNCHA